MKLTKDLKVSMNPLLPEGWLGLTNETHHYLYTKGGAEIILTKQFVDINHYLSDLLANRKKNGK